MLKKLAAGLVLITGCFIGVSYYVSLPVVEGVFEDQAVTIADPSQALTFARTDKALILVSAHEGDSLRGINLTKIYGDDATEDLFTFAEVLDASSLWQTDAILESYSIDDLIQPVNYPYPSVAAGTNFREHAEEIYSDDPPFLFPKLVDAGPWNQTVPFVSRLDFEAEICAFPLDDIRPNQPRPRFGFVLCNDFTDRWSLVREVDLDEPLGRTGFATGKGCNRCLPTGYLVVIPQDPDFYRSIRAELFVNDRRLQAFSLAEMILSLDELVDKALRDADVLYQQGDNTVPLLPSDHLPKGTLILTGTGAGVLFKPLNIWGQQFYLQSGDIVRTQATYLGHLTNRIE
ncbi:MAG: fumarylacetoacetate hydrolase family protein [Proteobacteria bacterium]|nr:fumarylacetoacetate hydrolase family protein [Pseudomonadota bacterium]